MDENPLLIFSLSFSAARNLVIAKPNWSRARGMSSDTVAKISAQMPYSSAPSVFVSMGSRIKPFSEDTSWATPASPTSLVNFL